MQLQHIELSKLSISEKNMRFGTKPPDISDILPSVRARGVLVPLIVRLNGEPGHYEIVAGRRRYVAACEAFGASADAPQLPCAVMEPGDDAAALEASLIENVARSDPHEVEQWESFTRLVKEGRTPEEIALVFALTDRQVGQVLALGNLLPKIRDLYRREEIDPASIRFLTMATKARQKEWLALLADPNGYAPRGTNLKSWLFGGASIPTGNAVFELASYKGGIVADLFGEDSYFADANEFWEAQREAVEARRQDYLDAGWTDAVVIEPGSYFHAWEYEKTPKKKGGKVFITLSPRGEVAIHEGYLTRAEARRKVSGAGEEAEAKPVRAEVTSSLANYIDLHRHAAVRAKLADHGAVALRLMAAHAVSGSYLFSVKPDPQRPASDTIAESVETCPSETAFDQKRRRALDLLGFDADSPTVIQGYGGHCRTDGTVGVFLKLLALTDEEVLEVVAVVMGEALEVGSAVAEAVGLHLGVEMSAVWAADDAFFELVRDKEVLTAMIAELAGPEVASANRQEKTKGLKAILRDCLSGENGRTKVDKWVPRWMAFPPLAYTGRGGVGTVRMHAEVAPLLAPVAKVDLEPSTEPTSDSVELHEESELAEAA
jgi:ParB family chromosome partitioning protein